jgi:hypothetical protein
MRRAITPMLVEDLRAQFDAQKVGIQTQRKALMLLQGILRRAVVRGLIPANPVSVVGKPRQPPTRRPEPLAPATVERIRAQLPWRDATLVSVLAYAALRPEEATSARLGRSRRSHAPRARVEDRARADDQADPAARPGPRRMATRVRATSAHRAHLPTHDGDAWKLHDWQNWRRRVHQPAAKEAGVTGDLRVYRLRGSFVSLLLWEEEPHLRR